MDTLYDSDESIVRTAISGAEFTAGPSWHALGTGDFNGDGRSDILWQNSSGEVAIWEMNGTSVIGGGSVGNPGPSWHLMGSGDYNQDGRSDSDVAAQAAERRQLTVMFCDLVGSTALLVSEKCRS